MKHITLFLLLLTITNVQAQSRSKKKQKISYAKGTLWGYWGYNRSAYTKSDLRLIGQGYDFKLKNATAHDNPSHKLREYVDVGNVTVPQFNGRIGYYFKDHYSISFGYDHMKYIFDDGNQVLLDGYIKPGLDTVWMGGTYDNVPVVTNREHFHYENSNGLNYLHFEFIRTDQWYQTRNKQFAISTNFGIGLGGLLSFNDFTFAQKKDMATISLSGYGISGHASVRFEFFKHLFLQTEASGGFMHQLHVRTRHDDLEAYAKQKYGYAMGNVTIGFFLYVRPTNSCNSCPHW